MNAFEVLKNAYGDDIAKHVCDSYKEIESHHALGKWKTAELDAGHFVEAVRRLLEKQLTGAYTAFHDPISKFNDQALKFYEAQTGHESFRMLIPQALKAIYSIRNKRGVGHVAEVVPNRMDSAFLLQTAKWVLGEIVRLNAKTPIDETEKLVTAITERKTDGLWKEAGSKRVLNVRVSAREEALILLYDESPTAGEKLRQFIEYKNKANFWTILRRLHRDKLIHLMPDGNCYLLPAGLRIAESLLLS